MSKSKFTSNHYVKEFYLSKFYHATTAAGKLPENIHLVKYEYRGCMYACTLDQYVDYLLKGMLW